MDPLRPGLVVDGSFELLRPIGEGGMGKVWLARDRALGRDVALKAMRPSDSATRTRRFEREARALAALDHPSILPVLHAGEDPATGLRYLVTPAVLLAPAEIARLCDEVLLCPYPHGFAEAAEAVASGGRDAPTARPPLVARHPPPVTAAAPRPLPLSALLDGGKALPEAAVLRIARDLAGALAAAHAVGILHRDVKPSNVLFDASGRALLADFGLAKFLEAHAAAGGSGGAPPRSLLTISLDESGSRKFLGSPAYAAPEQFRDGAELTPALDWYSLGAVLYEALTGDRPRSLRPPSSYDPSRIARAWDPFLRDLLEPDPARRLADPAAIARRLDAIGRAIDPATRRRRRAARAALAIAAVFATIMGVIRFHAEPGPVVESHADSAEAAEPSPVIESHAESAEVAEPSPGVETHAESAEAAEPSPVTRHPSLVTPAAEPPAPPRLDSVWQGDDRGPLQLLGSFRLAPIENLVAEAVSTADPETRRLLEEGDRAWSASPRDLYGANKAWFDAANRLGRSLAASASGGPGGADPASLPALPRICYATVLVRLSWSYLAAGRKGASDAPFRDALAVVDPLVRSDPARYGPFRGWILSERAYVEAEEGRFRESAEDLREAGLLWGIHAPLNDPGCEAQLFVLATALGGMLHQAGNTAAALAMTSGTIDSLEPFLFPDESPSPDETSHASRPDPLVTRHSSLVTAAAEQPLLDLLAGCHYRLGELHREIGSGPESIAAYRRAADLWRDLFRAHGERYRGSCIQALGRVGQSLANAERLEEAVAAWDEIRDLVAPLLASDPALYRPVVAATLDNLVRAHRILGDEDRARALEAEAAALRPVP